jgi:hypothetical protein
LFTFTVPRFVNGALTGELAPVTVTVAPARLVTEEPGLVRIEAWVRARLELLSSAAPPESCRVLTEVRVPGPEFTSLLPMTVSVPLIVKPPFAKRMPVGAPMLDVPDDVNKPLIAKWPLFSAAPFKVNAFKNVEPLATVSEAGAVAPESTKLLAVVKVLTDWLPDSVTVVPANGVSMHTLSAAAGILAGL